MTEDDASECESDSSITNKQRKSFFVRRTCSSDFQFTIFDLQAQIAQIPRYLETTCHPECEQETNRRRISRAISDRSAVSTTMQQMRHRKLRKRQIRLPISVNRPETRRPKARNAPTSTWTPTMMDPKKRKNANGLM